MKLCKFGDPILKRVCPEYDPSEFKDCADLGRRMDQLLVEARKSREFFGCGLGAPQVGSTLRVAVIKPNAHLPSTILINPRIIEKSERMESAEEGCLSYPGVFVKVERHYSVRVEYIDVRGRAKTQLFTDWDARIVQHECDHLEGICLVGDEWRRMQAA